MKICFIRLSALGDVAMMIPMAKALRKNFPEAELTWIIDRNFLPLVEKIEGIEFIPVQKIKSIADFLRMRRLLKNRYFDVCLATQASFSAHLFYPLIQAKRKIGYDNRRGKDGHSLFVREKIPFAPEHTVDGFLQFAKYLGAKDINPDGRIPLQEEDYSLIHSFVKGEPYCVINPFSTREERDWSLDRYIQVGKWIHEQKKVAIIITGSKKDHAKCDHLANNIPGSINLAGKTSLRELTATLDKALFLISPDTGPIHIASSMQTPVIGLFAASFSEIAGPYFSREYVIDKYQLAFLQNKKTKWTNNNWNQKVYEKNIMDIIEVQDVIEKISLILSM